METVEYQRMYEFEDHYWWFVGRRRMALSLLKRFVRGDKPKLLDLGCGTGAALSELAPLGDAYGCDFSQLALQFSASRGLPHLIQGDGENLPIATGTFDGIIALDVFEHIKDHYRAYQQAFRVLAPGGVLVLSVPAYRWLWGPHDVALHHFRRYSRREVRAALEQAGFEVEKMSYSVFFLFPVVMMIRLLDKFKRGDATVSLPTLPPLLNKMLIRLQDIETSLIHGPGLPWGSSVVAVARRPLA